MNSSGVVTDTYDYDGFGILIHQTGSTPNVYLFAGEQFDAEIGFYYQRARYLNPTTGRFLTPDHLEGELEDPS
jgi:RHS repeat-associated protein